jgi:signal recognition particle GTPase
VLLCTDILHYGGKFLDLPKRTESRVGRHKQTQFTDIVSALFSGPFFPTEASKEQAIAYGAVQAGYSRDAQAAIIGTPGRLHTKSNLMEELKKIERVVAKHDASAPHQVLPIMGATAGQNGSA